jgi:hypothetical protein
MAINQDSRQCTRSVFLLVKVLSVAALISSLATRTFHLELSDCITVQSNSPQAIRQHLDRDAIQWTTPAPKSGPLQTATFHLNRATVGPLFAKLILDENLYNRPPPSC